MMGSTMYAAIQAVTPRPNTPAIALELMMTEPKPLVYHHPTMGRVEIVPDPLHKPGLVHATDKGIFIEQVTAAQQAEWSAQDTHLTHADTTGYLGGKEGAD